MTNFRILQDLHTAYDDGSGALQETQALFTLLSQSTDVDVHGFIFAHDRVSAVKNPPAPLAPLDSVMKTNAFFHDILEYDLIWQNKQKKYTLLAKKKVMRLLKFFYAMKTTQRSIYTIDASFSPVIFRQFLKFPLRSEDRIRMATQPFCYSNLTHYDIESHWSHKIKLNTHQYDFVLFPYMAPIKLSSRTQKIIRFYDSATVLNPDLFDTKDTQKQLNHISLCKKDTYFVCNSNYSQTGLLKLLPELELRNCVIPPLSVSYENAPTIPQLQNLLNHGDSYILSTTAPIQLIKAWEKLTYHYHHTIPLIIVADPNELSTESLRAMQPYLDMKKILLLPKMPLSDMAGLYAHAQVFINLTYQEGLGLFSLQAIQQGCPVLSNNTLSHKMNLAEAALYCDMYDVDSIAEKLAKLVCLEGAEDLRQQLICRGFEKLRAHAPDVIRAQWINLFKDLKMR